VLARLRRAAAQRPRGSAARPDPVALAGGEAAGGSVS